jgi:hypothetical protein
MSRLSLQASALFCAAVQLSGCLFDNDPAKEGNVGPAPAVSVLPDGGAGTGGTPGTTPPPGTGGEGAAGQTTSPGDGGTQANGGTPAGGGDQPGGGGKPVGGEGGAQANGGAQASGGDQPPPPPPPAGSLGSACENDADCAPGGTCITGLPGGYCSFDCADAECPEGGSCWDLGEAGSRCLLTCGADRECRGAEGYICDADSTCYPGESGGPAGMGDVGGPCEADADCGAMGSCIPEMDADGATGFVGGYCLTLGCSDAAPCAAGSSCYSIGNDQTACLATCSGPGDCRAGYACDPVGACLPACTANSCTDGQICGDDGLCREPPCTPQSCGAGTICGADGYCQIDLGDVPAGPPPRCNPPAWDACPNEANCGDVVAFTPREGEGYFCNHDEYRSFIRRDVMLMIKNVAARVACATANWDFGNGPPLGLGDMSEENGDIPGTSIGSPGHPAGTHENGFDMDIAYYQINTANNQLRPVCTHIQGGEDQYHCIAAPTTLDVWRTALFIGYLHDNPQLRVIGADGRIGPLLTRAIDALCTEGWLRGTACNDLALTFEPMDEGRGWFYFHHHHFHVSFTDRPSVGLNAPVPGLRGPANEACITRGCFSRAPRKSPPARLHMPR